MIHFLRQRQRGIGNSVITLLLASWLSVFGTPCLAALQADTDQNHHAHHAMGDTQSKSSAHDCCDKSPVSDPCAGSGCFVDAVPMGPVSDKIAVGNILELLTPIPAYIAPLAIVALPHAVIPTHATIFSPTVPDRLRFCVFLN